jgi:hypothetical protein
MFGFLSARALSDRGADFFPVDPKKLSSAEVRRAGLEETKPGLGAGLSLSRRPMPTDRLSDFFGLHPKKVPLF